MKRFDVEAIKDRQRKRLNAYEEWSLLLKNSLVNNLLDAEAESLAELARYLEYLYLEKKWTTAQNVSSLNAMAALTGRRPRRARSAVGYAIISHKDEEGGDRLINLGKYFFNIDAPSDWDDIRKKENATPSETKALVPWTHPISYTVPEGTVILSKNGIPFTVLKSVSSRCLSEPYSLIESNPNKKLAFLEEGGWEGIKYLKVPIIQGIPKTYDCGFSVGKLFETFVVRVNNVEEGDTFLSQKFLKVTVKYTSGEEEVWTHIPRLHLAEPHEKVFEIITADDYSAIMLRFGDNNNGKALPRNAHITFHYLETLGSKGNIYDKYELNKIIFPAYYRSIDPRKNVECEFLSVTNDNLILGGADAEDIEDIRINTPTEYLKTYSLATAKAFEDQIKKFIGGVSKIKIFSKNELGFLSKNRDSDYENKILKEIPGDPIYLTAISLNGSILDKPDDLMRIVNDSMKERKSPLDFFVYLEPNFIKLKIGVKIYPKDVGVSAADMKSIVKKTIMDKYSIFASDFKKPFIYSDLIFLLKNLPFVADVKIHLEAVADCRFNTKTVSLLEKNGRRFVKIDFFFDTVYSNPTLPYTLRGFKNKNKKLYLLKTELIFNKSPSKNRIVFLLDKRKDDVLTVEEAKYYNEKGIRLEEDTNIRFTEFYDDVLVRTAQFPYIADKVTDEDTMIQFRNFDTMPSEILPYVANSVGGFVKDINTGENIPDSRYIDGLDIIFQENYVNPEDEKYATGSVIIPASYFPAESEIPIETNIDNLIAKLKNTFTLKVMAIPHIYNIIPPNGNDIIFVEESDISVEVSYITSM